MCSSKRKATCAVELYLTTKALEIYSGACSMTKHHPRPLGSSSLLPRRDICIGWKHLSPYHVTSYLFVSYHVRFLWFTAFFGVSIYCVYIYIHLYIVQILNLIIHSYHIYISTHISYIVHIHSYVLVVEILIFQGLIVLLLRDRPWGSSQSDVTKSGSCHQPPCAQAVYVSCIFEVACDVHVCVHVQQKCLCI